MENIKRMEDRDTRLFYGACLHAQKHTDTLKEFAEFKDEEIQRAVRAVEWKVQLFQTERVDNLEFKEHEWSVCQKLVDCETDLLKRLEETEGKQAYTSDQFAQCSGVLESAYRAYLDFQDKVKAEYESAGYEYNEKESSDGSLIFEGRGETLEFISWQHAEQCLASQNKERENGTDRPKKNSYEMI